MKKTIRNIALSAKNFILPRHESEESIRHIRNRVAEGKPLMVARLGAVEIKGICYSQLLWPIGQFFKAYTYRNMPRNAGFFPANDAAFKRFSEMMIEDMRQVDILGSWRPEEVFFLKELKNSYMCALGDLGPIDRPDTWIAELKGKRVLVVHPFAETIERQYRTNRAKIWRTPDLLPEMQSLQAIKAVQSIAGNTGGFESWFDALDYMKTEIDRCDFDICLLGCGAYGFPLAAHVKRKGKIALHLGGVVQLLFGIKGKRWDNYGFYNEFWVSPSENEVPNNFKAVEGGCYW